MSLLRTPKRILITGAAGVIGTQLVQLLQDRGEFELVAGDLKPRPQEFCSSVNYIQEDLNELTQSTWDAFDPEVVFHLAASFERSTESLDFWAENMINNVELSHKIASLASKSKNKTRLIFPSSYLVYDPRNYMSESGSPPDQSVRLSSNSSLNPRNLVGAAKLYHENELRFMTGFPDSQIDAVIVRIYRGYGLGSRDVISRWIRSLLRGERINAFGLDSRFDFIYCKDSAAALAAIGLNSGFTGICDLGSGVTTSIREVVDIVQDHFPNSKIEIHDDPYPVENSCADTELLEGQTAWKPKYSVLEGVKEIIQYEQKRL